MSRSLSLSSFRMLAHQFLSLLRDGAAFGIRASIHHVQRGVGNGRMAGGSAQQFHHHVDRNRMNIGSQAFRMIHAAITADEIQHPQERFLANVFNQFRGSQAIAQSSTGWCW